MDIKNFIYYNWLKIAAIVFVIVFLLVTFRQCSQRVETDLGIMYVGEAVVSDKLPKLAEEIEKAGIISSKSRQFKRKNQAKKATKMQRAKRKK